MSALAQKKIVQETQYIVSTSSSVIPVSEPSLIPFAVNVARKEKKRIENIKVTVHELIEMLTDKQTENEFYKLTFTGDARGPMFGPLQLDLATHPVPQIIISSILATEGLSPAFTRVIIDAAKSLSGVNATPEEKQYYFTTQIGNGNLYEGEEILHEINALLSENADYINSEFSHLADEMADEINEYLTAIGYVGIPKPDVTRFLAKLVRVTGSLVFLKKSGPVGTITGPATVDNIKAMLKEAGRMETASLWEDIDAGHRQAEFSDDCGNWYVVDGERTS